VAGPAAAAGMKMLDYVRFHAKLAEVFMASSVID
jgi:hypothetical protein